MAAYFTRRERGKKKAATESDADPRRASKHSLAAFRQRLLDLCSDDICRDGCDRTSLSKKQTEHVCAIARELGISKSPGIVWSQFRQGVEAKDSIGGTAPVHIGTEHLVEFSEKDALVVKITIPPHFGLVPRVFDHPVVNLRSDLSLPSHRMSLENVAALPLEYLDRWIAANDVFGDDVRLESVLEWADGNVSFVITQPQYHGKPAPEREIDRYFEGSGWKRILAGSGNVVFYNYAFQVLAVDVLARNCYLHGDVLLPFDVILCHPDEALEHFLQLYPK